MYENLPGGQILEHGLRSLSKGEVDENSLLLLMGAYRLGQCGIAIAPRDFGPEFPEDQLYELLTRKHGDQAYRVYRNLTRTLASLENALENLTNDRSRTGDGVTDGKFLRISTGQDE